MSFTWIWPTGAFNEGEVEAVESDEEEDLGEGSGGMSMSWKGSVRESWVVGVAPVVPFGECRASSRGCLAVAAGRWTRRESEGNGEADSLRALWTSPRREKRRESILPSHSLFYYTTVYILPP